jgi:hypothetical protein
LSLIWLCDLESDQLPRRSEASRVRHARTQIQESPCFQRTAFSPVEAARTPTSVTEASASGFEAERSVDAGGRCLPGPRGARCGARGALGALSGGGIIGIRLPPSTLAFRKGPTAGRRPRKALRARGLVASKYYRDPCKIALNAATRPFQGLHEGRRAAGWPLSALRGARRGLHSRWGLSLSRSLFAE